MIVNLGSIEVDDNERRLIRRTVFGHGGYATRHEVRDFVIAAFRDEIETVKDIEAEQ